MADGECKVLDTRKFDEAIAKKDDLIKQYDELNATYDKIVKDLENNWEGYGAEAFMTDAKSVRQNITGIYDILKTMCDTLVDCKEVFAECDSSLGEFNRNPETK